MTPLAKVGIVTAGYVAAFAIATAVVAVHIAFTSGPIAQASSGMYAFGDAILFLAIFAVLAAVPTGAALFFLSSHRAFWRALAAVAGAVALTGIAALVVIAFGSVAVDWLLQALRP